MHTIHATPQDNPSQPEQPSPTDSRITQEAPEAALIEAQHARVPEAAFLVGCLARIGSIELDVENAHSIEGYILAIRAVAGALNEMYPGTVARDLPFPW